MAVQQHQHNRNRLLDIIKLFLISVLELSMATVQHSHVKNKRDLIQSILGRSSNPPDTVRSRLRIMEAFKAEEVVPDVIDGPPPKELGLSFGTILVEPGMKLTPTQVKAPPVVTFDGDTDSYYTLIMNDPDAPSRSDPKFGEWHHWLVVNIPGGEPVSDGETVAEYVGAGPPPDTGYHRYVYLVYKQPFGKKDFGLRKLSNRSHEGRAKHSIRDFLNKAGLSELVAGNYFLAKYDDYVPKLYAQLNG